MRARRALDALLGQRHVRARRGSERNNELCSHSDELGRSCELAEVSRLPTEDEGDEGPGRQTRFAPNSFKWTTLTTR